MATKKISAAHLSSGAQGTDRIPASRTPFNGSVEGYLEVQEIRNWIRSNGGIYLLAAEADGWNFTGSTVETTVKTVTIPGGLLGDDGIIRVTTMWSNNSNANAKFGRIKFGGSGGATFHGISQTTSTLGQGMTMIRNVNAPNVQKGFAFNSFTSFGVSTAAMSSGTIDTTVNQDMLFNVLLANAADNLKLESYMIELMVPDN